MPDPLPVREAYRLWAPRYDSEESPITTLDDDAVRALSSPLTGCAVLDAACGTGRRTLDALRQRPRDVVGVDLVREMLAVGRSRSPEAKFITADFRKLPFPPESFDVVWCRLAAGYVPELPPLYCELARVLKPAGYLLVTDFHPAASEAGHRRICHDAEGQAHTMESYPHEAHEHEGAASASGLHADRRLNCPVGPPVKSFYEAAGMLDRYQQDVGLPLVFAWRFARGGTQ